MITDYLLELLDELRWPTRRRRLILAEVEDHLTCAAAELHASGLDVAEAECEAARRFGPAGELARAFLEQQAALGGKRAAPAGGPRGPRLLPVIRGRIVVVCCAAGTLTYGIAAALTTSAVWFDVRDHPWRSALAVATVAGVALGGWHALIEGVDVRHLPGALLAPALIATIEALAALLGFAVLGRFLGIRAPRAKG